jgi:hypothetical protein
MASLCADGLASRGKTVMYVVGEHHASGDPLTDVRADISLLSGRRRRAACGDGRRCVTHGLCAQRKSRRRRGGDRMPGSLRSATIIFHPRRRACVMPARRALPSSLAPLGASVPSCRGCQRDARLRRLRRDEGRHPVCRARLDRGAEGLPYPRKRPSPWPDRHTGSRSAPCGRYGEDGLHHPDGTHGGARCNG